MPLLEPSTKVPHQNNNTALMTTVLPKWPEAGNIFF